MEDLNKIKESISEILEAGGTVQFSYKKSLDDWYFETSISKYYDKYENKTQYIIHNGKFNDSHEYKDETLDKFVKYIFNKKNLAYVIKRLVKRVNFNPEHYDFQRPCKELLDLIEEEKQIIKAENKPTNTINKIVEEFICEEIKKYKETTTIVNG